MRRITLMNPADIVKKHLAKYREEEVPTSVRGRYADILVCRAVVRYLDNDLDSVTIEEDLYDDINNNQDGLTRAEAKEKGIMDQYPNLTFSEESLEKEIKDLVE